MNNQQQKIASARQAGEHLHHFPGGLRLRHNKKISCELTAQRPPLPDKLYLPLSQHIGAPAKPLIKAGQAVLKGQPIAAADGPRSAWIHAPSSGIVEAIQHHPVPHASGETDRCIVLALDGEDRWCELQPLDYLQATAEALQERIFSAGIVGLGGAVFPTHLKLDRPAIHTVIINGAECEPYISCDEMLMREQPHRVLHGAKILQQALGAEQVIVAIEDQMGTVQQIFSRVVDEQTLDVKIRKVTTIYPEGGERQLIQVLTGLEVPDHGLPQDLGLVCLNVGTAAAVYQACAEGQPLVERYVTVTGNGVKQPRNLVALLGTPIAHLIQHAGGYQKEAARLVMGGPMMGVALSSDTCPVVKACNCILILSEADIHDPLPEMPCINCGECVRVCPAKLLPQQLHWHIRAQQWDQVAAHHLHACIECGCCDFVCPSHIPLVDYFRFGKGEIRQQQQEKQQSDRARQRFEAREQRLEQQKQQKRQRLEEKKQALRDRQARQGKIQAAIQRVKDKKAREHQEADDEV